MIARVVEAGLCATAIAAATIPSGLTAQHHDHHDAAASADAGLSERAREQIEAVRNAVSGLATPEAATRSGFREGFAWLPTMGTHWVSPERTRDGFDLLEPDQLMFSPVGGKPTLVGVAYAFRDAPGTPMPEGFDGSGRGGAPSDFPEFQDFGGVPAEGLRPPAPGGRGVRPIEPDFRDEFGPGVPEGFGGEFGRVPGRGVIANARALSQGVLSRESVKIWAHDFDVESGKVYRYRMRVVVTNVLFGNEGRMPKDQAEKWADKFLVESDWSEWTEPVRVEPSQYFFVTKAVTGGLKRRAEVTVFKFFAGQWWKEQFEVAPGDPIGHESQKQAAWINANQQVPVDFFTGLWLVDLETQTSGGDPIAAIRKKDTRVHFLNDGRIITRNVEEDKNDPTQQRLDQRVSEQSPTRGVAGRGL